jgi:hypothetical protein
MRVGLICAGLAVFMAVAAGYPAAAAKGCYQGRGHVRKKLAGGFEIRISPSPDKEDIYDAECRAVVLDAKKKTIFAEDDWGFTIEVAGEDVNADGIPDVVLEAYSGGAHCCWTYYIISLGAKPGLRKKFENNRDAAFFWDKEDRRIEIVTRDGNFDYFDGLCHACTPFPIVYLRLDGATLVDISPSSLDDYDAIISQNQKALTAPELQHLRVLKENPSDDEESRKTIYKALNIVFAYLYSGREAQAREALQQMWPPFDQERMWKLIGETRRDGILCYTRKNAVCGLAAATN